MRLAAAVLAAALYCQAQTGEVRVQVKDPSGSAMEASGRLESLSNGAVRLFRTDPQGAYTFTALPFARYRMEVSAQGFATQTVMLDVRSAAPVSRTVTMVLGAASSTIEVVAATPLAGSDLAVNEIPAPVQTATREDIANSGSLDLSDLLNRRLSGVNINENQENPFQPDVNYRGYTASPLLGTPQGISVYVDGVRQNQPFGDVVSWDLIPRIAIADVALVPGSNPLFGLNTLGGAVSVDTKDGRSAPGTALEVSGGSFGRRAVEFETGGMNARGLHWYAAGNWFHEDGWRVASPSTVRQAFAKLGWQGAKTAVWLSFAYADNSLTGNGLQEQRFLARDYASVYTIGDVTTNRSPFFNLSLRRAVGSAVTFAGSVYFRHIRADTVNPNLNSDSLSASVYQPSAAERAALQAAGYSGYPTSGATASNTPFPFWRCIATALLATTPDEKCDGITTSGYSRQNNYGLSGQVNRTTSHGARHNQFIAGAAWDRSGVTFQQGARFGYINPDYTITPVNAFDDGARVQLHGVPQTWSLYATDTLSLGSAWSFTVSGRYNRTTIDNRGGGGAGSLDGQYAFGRLNPAAGLTYGPTHFLNAYASYSESSRAPTSIELGCADPDNPCNLPNALVSDPPLSQVTTRTFEAGVRGSAESKVNWSAGWFRADNHNDLLFVASQQTGNGYFKNFGRTLRQGAELHLSGHIGRAKLGANYTFVSATYQTPETLDGASNSANAGGVIVIRPGDRIPLIPQHLFKALAEVQATKRLSVDLDLVAVSRSYARGNENNRSVPDGVLYLGPGSSPGYGVVNLAARYQVHKRVQLFAQVNNLLDHRYYSAAQLGPTGFTSQGTFIAGANVPTVHATFYAPGAPIGAWGGIKATF